MQFGSSRRRHRRFHLAYGPSGLAGPAFRMTIVKTYTALDGVSIFPV